MGQHVALLFNLGVLKKLFAGFGGCPPPASYGPAAVPLKEMYWVFSVVTHSFYFMLCQSYLLRLRFPILVIKYA